MLSVLEQSSTRLHLRVSSDPALLADTRRQVEAFATGAGFDGKVTAEIGLCVNEAMSNIIRYAYGCAADCPIELTARVDERAIELTIRDWGGGEDPSTHLSEDRHDPLHPGGLGMICLRSLMDEVKFVPQARGMLLMLVRRR